MFTATLSCALCAPLLSPSPAAFVTAVPPRGRAFFHWSSHAAPLRLLVRFGEDTGWAWGGVGLASVGTSAVWLPPSSAYGAARAAAEAGWAAEQRAQEAQRGAVAAGAMAAAVNGRMAPPPPLSLRGGGDGGGASSGGSTPAMLDGAHFTAVHVEVQLAPPEHDAATSVLVWRHRERAPPGADGASPPPLFCVRNNSKKRLRLRQKASKDPTSNGGGGGGGLSKAVGLGGAVAQAQARSTAAAAAMEKGSGALALQDRVSWVLGPGEEAAFGWLVPSAEKVLYASFEDDDKRLPHGRHSLYKSVAALGGGGGGGDSGDGGGDGKVCLALLYFRKYNRLNGFFRLHPERVFNLGCYACSRPWRRPRR